MAPTQTVEKFRVPSRSLLKHLAAGNSLTVIEKSFIALKIEALCEEFLIWRKRRTRMPLRPK
jgi:hypothetical protein